MVIYIKLLNNVNIVTSMTCLTQSLSSCNKLFFQRSRRTTSCCVTSFQRTESSERGSSRNDWWGSDTESNINSSQCRRRTRESVSDFLSWIKNSFLSIYCRQICFNSQLTFVFGRPNPSQSWVVWRHLEVKIRFQSFCKISKVFHFSSFKAFYSKIRAETGSVCLFCLFVTHNISATISEEEVLFFFCGVSLTLLVLHRRRCWSSSRRRETTAASIVSACSAVKSSLETGTTSCFHLKMSKKERTWQYYTNRWSCCTTFIHF